MEKIEKCECWVGVRYDYENTDLVTLADLKEHIEEHNNSIDFWKKAGFPKTKAISLEDYCDKRKSTDLTRFNYCPICGEKIDWEAIKGGRMADMTNYESIKNMSIEEMSYIFAMVKLNSVKELYPKFEIENNMIEEQCENCFKWLNSEVEDG